MPTYPLRGCKRVGMKMLCLHLHLHSHLYKIEDFLVTSRRLEQAMHSVFLPLSSLVSPRITSYHLVSPRITSHYLVCTYIRTHTQTHTHTYTHTYPHIPTHTHTYTHTHSYTRTPRMQRTHIRKVSQATDRLKAQKVGWRAEEKEGWKEKGKKTTF